MTDAILKQGTWIRTKVLASDSGDFNDRHAPVGSLGRIEAIDGGNGGTADLTVVFWPSFVLNTWSASDVSADAEVLPEGHPDIPSDAAFDLASAVADIVADGEWDPDEGTVTAPEDVVARIVAAAGTIPGHEAEIRRLMMAELGGGEVTLSAEEFNRLAEMTGPGDRLPTEPFPAAARR